MWPHGGANIHVLHHISTSTSTESNGHCEQPQRDAQLHCGFTSFPQALTSHTHSVTTVTCRNRRKWHFSWLVKRILKVLENYSVRPLKKRGGGRAPMKVGIPKYLGISEISMERGHSFSTYRLTGSGWVWLCEYRLRTGGVEHSAYYAVI